MKIPFSQAVTPWMMGIGPVDFRDKGAAVQSYVRYMLDRTNRMIKVNGLPESIPEQQDRHGSRAAPWDGRRPQGAIRVLTNP